MFYILELIINSLFVLDFEILLSISYILYFIVKNYLFVYCKNNNSNIIQIRKKKLFGNKPRMGHKWIIIIIFFIYLGTAFSILCILITKVYH